MPAIVTSAEIDRPAAEVFAYATDPARFSEWQEGVVDGHMDGPPDGTQTLAVGARCVTTRRIGGASRPSTSELTHIDPPRTWGVRGTDGPIRAAGDLAPFGPCRPPRARPMRRGRVPARLLPGIRRTW
jgi:Polyketide cyclase / dehydrase and lipid transport